MELGTRLPVSLCMIVRDEADALPGGLAPLRGCFAQIAVVDTGSTDRTPEIARSFGAQVASFAWIDDFSAARNASLDLAREPWILILDADEALGTDDLRILRELLAFPVASAYRIETLNYTNDASLLRWSPCPPEIRSMSRGADGYFPSGKVRLFRNDSGVRFEGTVHEGVEPSLLRLGWTVGTCGVRVHHYGYLRPEAGQVRKRDLYRRLGERKLAEAPDDAAARLELAKEALAGGDLPGARAGFETLTRRRPESAEGWLGLGMTLERLGDDAGAESAYRSGGDDPRLLVNLAALLARRGDLPAAAELLRRAVRDPAAPWIAWTNLAAACAGAGRPEEAREALAEALRRHDGDATAWAALAELEERAGEAERALRTLETAMERRPDSGLLPFRLAAAGARAGRTEQVVRILEAFLARHPDAATAKLVLAEALLDAGGADPVKILSLLDGLFVPSSKFQVPSDDPGGPLGTWNLELETQQALSRIRAKLVELKNAKRGSAESGSRSAGG